VDHEKLAEARIRAMTAADLNRFLVTCALASRALLPRLQFGRGAVEGSESQADSGPLQSRRIEDRHQSDCSAVQEAEWWQGSSR
jgi:hypothetical protein